MIAYASTFVRTQLRPKRFGGALACSPAKTLRIARQASAHTCWPGLAVAQQSRRGASSPSRLALCASKVRSFTHASTVCDAYRQTSYDNTPTHAYRLTEGMRLGDRHSQSNGRVTTAGLPTSVGRGRAADRRTRRDQPRAFCAGEGRRGGGGGVVLRTRLSPKHGSRTQVGAIVTQSRMRRGITSIPSWPTSYDQA